MDFITVIAIATALNLISILLKLDQFVLKLLIGKDVNHHNKNKEIVEKEQNADIERNTIDYKLDDTESKEENNIDINNLNKYIKEDELQENDMPSYEFEVESESEDIEIEGEENKRDLEYLLSQTQKSINPDELEEE